MNTQHQTNKKTRESRHSIKFAGYSLLIALLLISGVLFIRHHHLNIPQVRFIQKGWDRERYGQIGVPAARQKMIRDLILNRLPGMDRNEIVKLLGWSPAHEQWRRQTREEISTGSNQRSGEGHYFDELDWDLIYEIGEEQIFLFDHRGQELSPDEEYLIIRVDSEGEFESWYIAGSRYWPNIVGKDAAKTYRKTR